MKVVFEAEELKKIVERASRFTRPFGFIPEFNYIHFSGDGVRAFGGYVGLVHLSSEIFEEDVAVPATLLSGFLPSLSNKVEIAVDKDVVFKSGSFTARLKKVEFDKKLFEFKIPEIDSFVKFPDDFFTNLKKIYFTVCKDETKLSARGVLWKDFFYSTDHYRMSRFKPPFEVSEPFVIPDLLLSLVIPEESEPIGYCFEGGRIWFAYEDYFAFGTCSALDFPDCEKVFSGFLSSDQSSVKVEFDSKKLTEAVSRMEPFARVYPNRLDVLVSPNNLVLFTSMQNAEANEVVPCKTSPTAKGCFTVGLGFFKEVVEKTDTLYFTDKFVFFSSKDGLESILLGVEVEPYAEIVLARIRSNIPVGEVEEAGKRTEKGKEETTEGSPKERKRTPKWEDPVPF